MTAPGERFPGFARATLLIALDNGGINRGRSEAQMKRELRDWMAKQPAEILPPIDAWLSGLHPRDLETVCCGEASEAAALLATAPPFTDQMLNSYFDEVC
ncbi:hypothetical protein [Ancylobacter sp. SL191]|uniref:hypothetical protein n=1 Tax=Ancylobacter sp. SL191 TaxID=2995166 RepID=UPI00226DC4CC|nr:hypothetical protein [Ancylobacter sp. SL191]WAC26376.1 hypothetical protein OU996_15325 [Ancylobacter sp. SL191]